MGAAQIKSKDAKAKAAAAGGKGKRKKWSKGKARDKLNNLVLFDAKTLKDFNSQVPKMKLITTSTVSERFKVTGTLARAALLGLEKEGKIRAVTKHSSQVIFTRATKA